MGTNEERREFHNLYTDAGPHLTHIHPPPTHRDT